MFFFLTIVYNTHTHPHTPPHTPTHTPTHTHTHTHTHTQMKFLQGWILEEKKTVTNIFYNTFSKILY